MLKELFNRLFLTPVPTPSIFLEDDPSVETLRAIRDANADFQQSPPICPRCKSVDCLYESTRTDTALVMVCGVCGEGWKTRNGKAIVALAGTWRPDVRAQYKAGNTFDKLDWPT